MTVVGLNCEARPANRSTCQEPGSGKRASVGPTLYSFSLQQTLAMTKELIWPGELEEAFKLVHLGEEWDCTIDARFYPVGANSRCYIRSSGPIYRGFL